MQITFFSIYEEFLLINNLAREDELKFSVEALLSWSAENKTWTWFFPPQKTNQKTFVHENLDKNETQKNYMILVLSRDYNNNVVSLSCTINECFASKWIEYLPTKSQVHVLLSVI